MANYDKTGLKADVTNQSQLGGHLRDFRVGYICTYLQYQARERLWTTFSSEAQDLVNRTGRSGYPAIHSDKSR